MLIHAAAHSDAFAAIVSEGASGQSVRDEFANPDLSERILDLPTQAFLTLSLATFASELPPPSLKSEVAKIAPTPVFFVYGEHGQDGSETEAEQWLLRGRARAEADLGGPERPARRRDHDRAGGVRASRRRLPR